MASCIKVLKNLSQDCFNILYPRLCLHCDSALEEKRPLFCTPCLEQLTLLPLAERCPVCFLEKDEGKKCKRCSIRYTVIRRQAAACEGQGPARSLSLYLEKGNVQLLSAATALMALQMSTLLWPEPDLVIPLTTSFSKLLAREFTRLINKPMLFALKTGFDKTAFLRQGELQRIFYLKKKMREQLCDKKILLVGLYLDDSILRRAAAALQEGFPQEIYALTFSN